MKNTKRRTSQIVLITGGIRSGKSRYVLERAEEYTGRKIFLATAQPGDDEMRERIQKHKQERPDQFQTIEEPLNIHSVIEVNEGDADVVVIDCLTLWMNNLFAHFKGDRKAIRDQVTLFIQALDRSLSNIMIISNEIGSGIIPDNKLAREFIDELGFLNQRVACLSDELILMVSGIAHGIKGEKAVYVEKNG